MSEIIDIKTSLLFIGGIFSLILMVVIFYSKQEFKRTLERKRLRDVQRANPEIGDIEQKLNDSFEYQKLSFIQELTNYGLQPLLIISFINLFDTPSVMDVIATFVFTIFTIMHELWSGTRYSNKRFYQILLLVCWIGLFFIINIKSINIKHIEKKTTENQLLQTHTKANKVFVDYEVHPYIIFSLKDRKNIAPQYRTTRRVMLCTTLRHFYKLTI